MTSINSKANNKDNLQLYTFNLLAAKLDEWGFPDPTKESSFEVIITDFYQAFKEKKIIIEDDGIFLLYKGKKLRGYVFIKEPHIDYKGYYPKFHLVRCEIINDFLSRGRFNTRYVWSNASVNDLIDKDTRKVYKKQDLNYCSYCRKIFDIGIDTTSEFHEMIKKGPIKFIPKRDNDKIII
jgi:hypothetical protein